METFNRITYEGADIKHFIEATDPGVLGLREVLLGLKAASAGADRVRMWAIAYAVYWLDDTEDRTAIEKLVHGLWDGDQEGEDLRTLAMRQADAYRNQACEISLSDNHPAVIADFEADLLARAKDLDAWARRPRACLLTRLREEEASPWPRPLTYGEKHHGAKDARFFVAQRPWKSLSSDGVLYTFRDGHWQETPDAEMASEVRATDPSDRLDVQHVNKLVEGVHQLTAVRAKPFEWIRPSGIEPAPEDLALFRNGLLDVNRMELIPHDGRYFATGLPDHDWDPFAECPTWMAWLNETLDPSFHPTLQELFGYCLTPDIRAHKFGMLLGGPRTGKSTAHNVLHRLVGPKHAASSTLADLSGDFGLEPLVDKRVVLIPDAHDAPAKGRSGALERIKSITGADPVSVNRKGKPIVHGVLKTRIIVTCNKTPKFIDESGALAARMIVIHFGASFLGREDRSMPDRLAAEMPGIANWALQGLSRLRSNGLRFTVGEAGRAEVEMAARSQSPALRFAESHLTVTGDQEHFTPMPDVFRSYTIWAEAEGLRGFELRSQNDLKDDLRAAIPAVRYTQRRVGGKRVYGLAGVSAALWSAKSDFDEEEAET